MITQVITIVEKKIRNLEKRKARLESYKEKQDKGQALDKDQKEAVAKIGEVLQNLEFAKELQKQYVGLQGEFEKSEKKRVKQEQKDVQKRDIRRVEEVLRLQGLLDGLGTPEAREFFKENESVKLTTENLDQLDQLYSMLSPTREEAGAEYNSQLNAASVHINHLLEGKDKAVVGTTYKELKQVIDKIYSSGYFDKTPEEETSQSGDKEPSESEEKEDYVVVDSQDVPEASSEEVTASLPQEPQQPAPVSNTPQEIATNVYEENKPAVPQQYEENTYYHTQSQEPVVKETKPDNFESIVTECSYNFLQDSQLDDSKAAQQPVQHIDPAVVAAHPMAPNMSAGDAFFSHESAAHHSQAPENTPHTAQFPAQPTYRTEDYSQSLMSQTLSNSTSSQSYNTLAESNPALGHHMDPSLGTADVPPAIPMPNQGGHGDAAPMGAVKDTQEKVTPFLNPEAAVFKMQEPPVTTAHQTFASSVSGSVNVMAEDKSAFGQGFQNDYQNSFGSSNSNQWSNNTNNRNFSSGNGPNTRGRGSAGSNGAPRGGRGGTSNGYNSRPSRGGNSWNNGGPRGGSNGGYNNRGNGGSRGGSRGGPRGGARGGAGPRGGSSFGGRPGSNQVQSSA